MKLDHIAKSKNDKTHQSFDEMSLQRGDASAALKIHWRIFVFFMKNEKFPAAPTQFGAQSLRSLFARMTNNDQKRTSAKNQFQRWIDVWTHRKKENFFIPAATDKTTHFHRKKHELTSLLLLFRHTLRMHFSYRVASYLWGKWKQSFV